MARHDDIYKGFRYIVDTIAAGDGRFGWQTVVDGKRPIIGPPCPTEADAMAAGIEAAQAKIESVLDGYRKPR
ncbi:hypothetical protein [Piscinibacter sakaiensis]|uniref:hypothetical protein n=1 Tax=Piscinibacter sakaiensis TaxID=1547922 RepID=UPI003AAC8A9B